jgi:hypothetical protein
MEKVMAAISLEEAEKIQAEQRLLAEAAFNRLRLEDGIGRQWHNASQWHQTWLTFWQGWWLSFLKSE